MDTLTNLLGLVGALCLAISVNWIGDKADKKLMNQMNRERRKAYRDYKKKYRKYLREAFHTTHRVQFRPVFFWIGMLLVSASYALPLGCTLLNLS